MVSVSCSTTIKVLPKSRISRRDLINFSLSFWWRPILGSSRTYNTPVNLDPIWVASLILWASPPDKVPADLAKVKYSRPTFFKKVNLFLISLTINSLILASASVNFKLSNQTKHSLIDIQVIS